MKQPIKKIIDDKNNKNTNFDFSEIDQQKTKTPKLQINLNECGPMFLDALIKMKNKIHHTFTFRWPCRDSGFQP